MHETCLKQKEIKTAEEEKKERNNQRTEFDKFYEENLTKPALNTFKFITIEYSVKQQQ